MNIPYLSTYIGSSSNYKKELCVLFVYLLRTTTCRNLKITLLSLPSLLSSHPELQLKA